MAQQPPVADPGMGEQIAPSRDCHVQGDLKRVGVAKDHVSVASRVETIKSGVADSFVHILEVMIPQKKRNRVRILMFQAEDFLESREYLKKRHSLVIVGIEIVTQEDDVFSPQVVLDRLLPEVASVDVRNDDHKRVSI